MNSPEDGPLGPKHVEIRQYTNKIEIVTSVGFYSIQEVLLCHSVMNYYKVKSFITVLRLLTWSGGSLCIGSQDRFPYLQQKPATHPEPMRPTFKF